MYLSANSLSPQDYHLAKRYYDLAAETSTEAQAPVALALLKLFLLRYYDTISDVRLFCII